MKNAAIIIVPPSSSSHGRPGGAKRREEKRRELSNKSYTRQNIPKYTASKGEWDK